MALAWPYGIADPHLYAYLAAAAASYPYSLPPPGPAGLPGFPPTHGGYPGPQMSAAPPSTRAGVPPELLGNLTNTYLRPNGFGMGVALPGSAPSGYQQGALLRSPLDQHTMSLLAGQPPRHHHPAFPHPALTPYTLGQGHPSGFTSSVDAARLVTSQSRSPPASSPYSPLSSHTPPSPPSSSPYSRLSPYPSRPAMPPLPSPPPTHPSLPSHSPRQPPSSPRLIHSPKVKPTISTSTGAPKGIFRPFQTEIEQS